MSRRDIGNRFRLTLRIPGQVPVVNRVRSALKTLLRAFGLRCERIEFLDPEKSDGAQKPKN